jgi:L-asparaginase
MVYTASALSFMLQDLDKPVILTGAQIPHLHSVRNDALQNLLTALLIANPQHAGIPVVPEVGIFFHDQLLRGNRARKVHASGFQAFSSPNWPPLGTAGESIVIDRRALRPAPDAAARLRTRLRLEPNVAAAYFFPGIQQSSPISHSLSDPSLRGIVLLTYGAGTVPSDDELLRNIAAAVRRGVVAVAVTQCGAGRVQLRRYQASTRLRQAGVVSGLDLTPEAALVKLMVLLGDDSLSVGDVRHLMREDLAGELTPVADEGAGPGAAFDRGYAGA